MPGAPCRIVSRIAPVIVLFGLGCADGSESPVEPETQLVAASTQTLFLRQVTVGGQHSCGLTSDGRAYCWGYAVSGQLGIGPVDISRYTPAAVAGGLRFAQLSAGTDHTCGVTTDDRAYCWGENYDGRLGDGTTANRWTPTPVAGGRRFRQIRAGTYHTCAVTPTNVAFCWGSGSGLLGDGTTTQRLTPVRVAGGLRFHRVTAGAIHTCGVTVDDRAYCWGYNGSGRLGDGTTTWHSKPVAVEGGLKFRQVVPGADHTCGVSTDDRAYCWGDNEFGQLGTGPGEHRTPAAVSSAARFRQVLPGLYHTCGVTLSGIALCWGYNGYGQNGDGTASDSRTPVPVAGGLSFAGISTGMQETSPFSDGQAHHTCGVTTGNRVYCWGYNLYGQVGDGTGGPGSRHPTPVAVVGPS